MRRVLAAIAAALASLAAGIAPTPARADVICPTGCKPTAPTGDVTTNGHLWHQVYLEDFLQARPEGWIQPNVCTNGLGYTGSTGAKLNMYGPCFSDTNGHPYRPDLVLSAHDGVLDERLQPYGNDRIMSGASVSPVLANGTSYQTYGRYSARARINSAVLGDPGSMYGYYQAFLLWPQVEADWPCSEINYPEAQMWLTHVWAFTKSCGATPQWQQSFNLDRTQWHIYTIERTPTGTRFYLDNALVATSTHVYSGPMRWQAQTEALWFCNPAPTECTIVGGHLFIDYLAVWSW